MIRTRYLNCKVKLLVPPQQLHAAAWIAVRQHVQPPLQVHGTSNSLP